MSTCALSTTMYNDTGCGVPGPAIEERVSSWGRATCCATVEGLRNLTLGRCLLGSDGGSMMYSCAGLDDDGGCDIGVAVALLAVVGIMALLGTTVVLSVAACERGRRRDANRLPWGAAGMEKAYGATDHEIEPLGGLDGIGNPA